MDPVRSVRLLRRAALAWRRRTMSTNPETIAPNKTRVIGIMAHIDAGKTTTTERMLYYSGFQSTVGEVHHGDTTMDYLQQERERGITIQSAAITFPWRGHAVSLVDTPGHVDFTMEVERCIRVVDGAVAVVDASAGVEAQTVTVWHQADRYGVPRLCYLNKMDKPAASVEDSLEDIRRRLGANPVLMQLPLGTGKEFRGVLDVITGRMVEWDRNGDNERGAQYSVSPPVPTSHPLHPTWVSARAELCDALSDLHLPLAEHVVDTGDLDGVPAPLLFGAVKEATFKQSCVPVFLGSSYRNTGVQPLMDAVLNYLPGPLRHLPPACALYSPGLCCLAFKISYDKTRGGLLTFVRVYSGTLTQSDRIFNVSRGVSERPSKMMIALADDFREVGSAGPGSIVVLVGLKKTSTGDTLVSSQDHVAKARQILAKKSGNISRQNKLAAAAKSSSPNKDEVLEEDSNENENNNLNLLKEEEEHLLVGVKIPEPVFFCSIEAASPRFQTPLEEALSIMTREDPSLTVTHDGDTGQLVLAGMGELHLEVVSSRLQSQYGVEADLGQLQVAYREQIAEPIEKTIEVYKSIGDTKQHVHLSLLVQPAQGQKFSRVQLKHTKNNGENLSNIRHPHLSAISSGVSSALSCGPVLSCPVSDVTVSVTWFATSSRTTAAFIAATAGQCVRQALTEAGCQLAEPVMLLTVTADEDNSHLLVADLAKRRPDMKSVTTKGGQKHIVSLVPLAELIGYSSSVRKLSSGRASFTMELHSYQVMDQRAQREAVKRITGFY